jgi:prepilin-type N-terminal cleavage/methylation domain-containing protein
MFIPSSATSVSTPVTFGSRRNRLQAFTLAEVMVAVGIMAVAFVSLYAGITFCFGVTTLERENLRATQVMLQRMEGIRLFNWNQLTNTTLNPPTFYERYFPGSGTTPASGLTYTGTVEVADLTLDPPASYSANMKKITVTVEWSSGNVPRIRSVSTYAAKDGIQNYVYQLNN